MYYALAFLCAIAMVLAVTPFLTKFAKRIGFVDIPTERKEHKRATPLTGGVSMFIAFTLTYIIFLGVSDVKDVVIIFGGFAILAIGIVDDYYKTKGKEFVIFPRVLVQFGASALVFAVGIRFTGFMNPFTDTYVLLPMWLQFIPTILWIFGVMTVINFSDGLDGLAGGLCGISAITLFITALYMNQPQSAFMAIILIGSIGGFLKYNFFPAKTFMGDSGAGFLGFILAVISLYGVFKQATIISVFIPVLALGVPIFDNIFVVIRRFIERKPIYKADAGQIHHRLLKTGLNPVQVVTFLFLVSSCLSLTSIIILLLKI